MKTNITLIPDIKNLFLETLLNKTNRISKIADHSIVNGVAYGVAKVLQKGMKDSALIESEQFPEFAYGDSLDLISKRYGLGERFSVLPSSTYVRVVGEVGTTYTAEQNIFITASGQQFRASSDWIIPDAGFTYVSTRSILQGANTIIQPYSITKILAPPVGHKYCVNEIIAIGGRNIESDDLFRGRIQEGFDYLATDTISKLYQILLQFEPSLLLIRKIGKTSGGNTVLGLMSQDGRKYSKDEIDFLLNKARRFLSISDLKLLGNEYVGIQFENLSFTYIDVDFRVDLYKDADINEFIINSQVQLSKYLDWRFWYEGDRIEWLNIINIIKNQPQVRFVSDQNFIPGRNVFVEKATLPRLRSFIMRTLSGKIIQDNGKRINPVFYEGTQNENFNIAVLSNI